MTIGFPSSRRSPADSVLVFAPGSDGDVKPTTVISGAKTLLEIPTDLTIRE